MAYSIFLSNILLLISIFFAVKINADNIFYSKVATTEHPHLLQTQRDSMLCMDIKPQHSLNMQEITGRWYGSEIIIHTQDIPGVYRYESCVIIYISDLTEQMRGSAHNYMYNVHNRDDQRQSTPTFDPSAELEQSEIDFHQRQKPLYEPPQSKYLQLVWSENADNLEYTFNYTDQSPGYWTNVREQRGTLATLNQYTQFSGSVQVLKAVNDHLVLTFCGSDLHSSIYTIVLSRTPRALESDELRSIHGLLYRRGLPTETIRQVCVSAAENLNASGVLGLILMLLLIINLRAK